MVPGQPYEAWEGVMNGGIVDLKYTMESNDMIRREITQLGIRGSSGEPSFDTISGDFHLAMPNPWGVMTNGPEKDEAISEVK
jgi:hypothetical protein